MASMASTSLIVRRRTRPFLHSSVNVLRDENNYKQWSAGRVLALSPGPAPSSGAMEGGVANVAGIVDGHDPAAVVLTAAAGTVSYGDLREQVDALRGGLAGIGVV